MFRPPIKPSTPQLQPVTQVQVFNVINNKLPWDGSYLGHYSKAIVNEFLIERQRYYTMILPDRGLIYCLGYQTKDLFPCIVDELKTVFGLPRRGSHQLHIDNKLYLIFYVPLVNDKTIVWEAKLKLFENKHPIRSNQQFKEEMYKIIAFCEILALTSTSETKIIIRMNPDKSPFPVAINDKNSAVFKSPIYDPSILTKTLNDKWLSEDFNLPVIIRKLINYDKLVSDSDIDESNKNLIIISNLRKKIQEVIRKYDPHYLWYEAVIIERLSRYLT